ncbi:hypothetical protein ACH4S8_37630 [Streptomyces sp. NPDC021080]|uniref:hypothetical protein n=1 Tax=Streptomyces sp. NPDC021080 TaxID=3365110 RepID=UPI0037A889DF
MTTPPPNGNSPQSLTGALARLTMQLQAMLHQNQTLNNLPSSARQYLTQARQQILDPAALLGGQVPAPTVPTAQWLNQTAASFLSQVVLNQPNRGTGRTTSAPPGPTPPTVPATPQQPGPGQMPFNPYMMWGMPGHMGMGGSGGYNGPYPGLYPGPLVAPQQSGGVGGGNGGASTGFGSWARQSAPTLGAYLGGPWGAVAGAAVAAATQIPAEVRSQRDKNAYYQSIEGGSNFDGFAERAHEEAYRWTTFGVLSSDEARKAFKGVTKLGYNSKVEGGIGRQDALNFIYHGKTRRGATVDESLQTLQVNSKNALGSLNDLNDALNAVSDSAGKAGINAQSARAEFTQLMDTAIKSGYGSASTEAARQEQDLKNSYGRSFQDVDASGRLSQTHAYMAASMSGISVSQYLTGGQQTKAGADQVVDRAAAKAALKPGVEDWIKARVKAFGGKLDEEQATQVAQEMLQQFYPNDPYALSAVVGSLSGYSNLAQDPVKAATWLVQQYNGKGALATAKADQKTTSKNNSVRGGKTTVDTPDQEQHGGFLGFGSSNSKAWDVYYDWMREKGHGKLQEDPVITSLLNKIHGDDKTKVEVTTKGGKRVVSLADAIKNHRNELASGKAVIVEGDQAGKSVADVLGRGGVDPLRDFSKEAKKADTSGESFSKWEKGGNAKEHRARQNFQLTLTPDARRLLAVMDSTGVAGSSATSTPPLSPFASNPSYQE